MQTRRVEDGVIAESSGPRYRDRGISRAGGGGEETVVCAVEGRQGQRHTSFAMVAVL
jgi:hypothetical protein